MREKIPFGHILRKTRYERRLSQEAFASMLGTSKQVISRYENNQRIPKITFVANIANKLDLPINYFISGEAPPKTIVAEKLDMPYATDAQFELIEETRSLSLEDLKLLIALAKKMKNG